MILNLLFPRRCVSCNNIGKYICDKCREKIKFVDFQFCPVCRNPSVNGATHARCQKINSLDGLFVPVAYIGPVKKAIHLVKYRYVTDLLDELCSKVFIRIPETFQKFDYLHPVPLHPEREKQRGFNQSFLIAKILGNKIGIPVSKNIIYRNVFTKPQFGLKVQERKINVRDVFQIYENDNVKNKNIILVDDVATTFSTLNECASLLKKKGASKVWAIVLAHGN